MRRSLTSLFFAFAATLGCLIPGGVDAVSGRRTKAITLKRTACYGSCPVYELTIFSDGRVEYNGKQFVRKTGKATGQISRKQLEELVMEFTNVYYFNLPTSFERGSKHCPQFATDHPSAITSIAWQGKSHSITHYHGCRGSNALELLRKLEDEIDKVVNVEQWTK